MKKLLLPALALAVLGSATVVNALSFVTVTDNGTAGSPPSPWTYGVGFTVGNTPLDLTDIQVINTQAGNRITWALWQVGTPNGIPPGSPGALRLGTIVSSTGTGGFTSVGAVAPLRLNSGTAYVLAASGFSTAGDFGDTAYGASTPSLAVGATQLFAPGSLFDFQANSAIVGDPAFYNPSNFGYAAQTVQGANGVVRFKAVNFTYAPIPEPETYAMVAGTALVGFGLWRRRQAK